MKSEFFGRVRLRKAHTCNIGPTNVKMLTDHLFTVCLVLLFQVE